jgi:hypothetical protein
MSSKKSKSTSFKSISEIAQAWYRLRSCFHRTTVDDLIKEYKRVETALARRPATSLQ